jgi:LuxR family transcriptional regulator, maltose regulon positive regulatory protein
MLRTEEPISKTKIVLPKRRIDLLSRARLLDILYERIDRKLIIISAAAGYGKTSLLIDLAYHSDWPFCWLTLDALDREPQRLIAGMIAALAEHFPVFGSHSKTLLSEITSLDEGLERVLVSLVNEIYADIHEHFVLVLDDFHVLDDAGPILQFVNRFIQLVGENCHVILAARTLPELRDLPLLVAREEVGGLDYSDLAFLPGEFQALLAQNRQVHLSDEDARRLVDSTEGWITGLQFTDLGRMAIGSEPFRTPARLGVTVFDYLGQQVMEQQPAEIQAFMLRSSLLEEFDARLCEAVLAPLYPEPPDWQKLLDTLTQKNLFALPVGANGQWLRYHLLFRDYLQDRFRRECPNEVRPILRRLAELQEADGQWEKAYQTYSQLDEPEALAGLIERAGIPMYQQAMFTLDSWLKGLSPSVVNGRASLLSLRGNVEATKGNIAEGIRLLSRAIERFRQEKNVTGLALALARRGNVERTRGNYDDAMKDLREAAELTEGSDDLQWIYADALRGEGNCRFRQGHTLQAMHLLEHALSIYMRIKDAPAIPLLLMETGMVHTAMGDYQEARSSYERAWEIWRENGDMLRQANLLNNLGVLHQQVGDYERAIECLEEGLLCAQRIGHNRYEALVALSLADVYGEVGDLDSAALNYRRAGELAQQLGDRFLINYHMVGEANLALLQHDVRRARMILDKAGGLIQGGQSIYEYGLYLLARGRLELQRGDAARAAADVAEAKQCFRQDGREMESIWASVWLAAAHTSAGALETAGHEIQEAFDYTGTISQAAAVAASQAMEWLEKLRTVGTQGSVVRRLFEKADRLAVQLPSVRRQLRRLARSAESQAPVLAIRAFGPGQVWVNGKLLSSTDWQTQSVRELFFFLLAARRPVSRDQVGAALWPGTEEPARFKMRFKNEIYRLRRAVGQESILFDSEMYYFNATVDHEYDVEDFEAYIARARSASRSAEQIDFYSRAVALVQGKYLQDMGGAWVIPEQERLHQMYLSAAHTLATLYRGDGQVPRAIEVCQAALASEPTFEAAYRLMMEMYDRMGDRGSVVHTYQRCEAATRKVYGFPPSEETQKLYHRLTS